jgi:hypothetical protein
MYLSEEKSVKRLSERAQSTMTPISWTEPPVQGHQEDQGKAAISFNVANWPKFRPQNTKGAT